MNKIDLKKELKGLYSPPGVPVWVEVPVFNYLMVDGRGLPDGSDAEAAIEALYAVAYTVKFSVKKAQGKDYAVMPLEGLWWSDDMADFVRGDKSKWYWTYLIMQPDFITAPMIDEAVAEVRRKKNPIAIDKLKFEPLTEARSAQIMHLGPYADETENIQKLHRFIHDAGYAFDGQTQKHHEIYLSDSRRTAPEKLKTVIRQPVIAN